MSVVRLSKSDKSHIINQLLVHKFTPAVVNFTKKSMKFTDGVYNDLYENELEGLKTISEDWFQKSSSFNVKFGDCFTSLDFTGRWYISNYTVRVSINSIIDSNFKLQARIVKANPNPVAFPLDHRFSEVYRELRDEHHALIKEIERAESTARMTIHNATTLKSLLEVWPELKPFTRFLDDRKGKNLPVLVDVEKLNKEFELPVDEDETV